MRRRILVVEDDRELRGALADLLRHERYVVMEAENGLDALRLLRTAAPLPDVVLLDLVMPLMSGWEFREALLRDPALATVPVIVLSASEPGRLSADATLTKLADSDAILATIARVLSAR